MLHNATISRIKTITAFIALTALLSFASFGCNSTGTTVGTNGVTITSVTATPATIQINNTTVIEGVVQENGVVKANHEVRFTVTPTTAGYFTPSIDTSDANGLVATVFTSLTEGNVTITATAEGGATATAPLSITSTPQVGSGNVTITTSSSLLLADGGSTSTVTVTVRDALSNPAPDGTVVRLSAGERFEDLDGDGYWTAANDTLISDANGNGMWDAIGSMPATAVVAGGAGQVTVTYTSGTVAATAYIYASVDDGAYTGSILTSIVLTPNATVNSIFMTVDEIDIAVKGTGGMETTTLRAQCYDAFGNAIPEGITVTFVITDGPGGTESIGSLGFGPYDALTNSQGIAIAPISSGTISGTIRARASVNTVLSNATLLLVHAGPAVEITVGVDTCNTRMWRVVNGRIIVTAVASDIYNNPVADSTAVYFTTDEGQVVAHRNATLDETGVASTEWISGYDVVGHDGIIMIYAETSGGTVRDSVWFINSDLVATLTLTGFPASLVVDGEDNAHFTINLFDLNGNPVVNGLLVDHRETFLTVSIDVSEGQCEGSFANATVKRSGPLNRDYVISPGTDDGIGAIDNVTFSIENASLTVACMLLTGDSYSKNSSIDEFPSEINEGQSGRFSATIQDRFGNPLGAHTLVASTSAGTISNGTQITNKHGEAYGFVLNAPVDPSIDKIFITITDTDPKGGGMVMTETVTLLH